jgi:hypothetical protein
MLIFFRIFEQRILKPCQAIYSEASYFHGHNISPFPETDTQLKRFELRPYFSITNTVGPHNIRTHVNP